MDTAGHSTTPDPATPLAPPRQESAITNPYGFLSPALLEGRHHFLNTRPIVRRSV